MERRDLLRSAAVGATLAWLPPFLRRAFGEDDDGGCAAEPARVALERARRRGKPWLVFVVPDDAQERQRRGTLFGELIDLGPDRSVALLALAEVACAPLDVVRTLAPAAAGTPGMDSAMMIVVDTDSPIVTPLSVARRAVPIPTPTQPPYSGAAEAAYYRRATQADVESLTAPLRRALAGPELGRRARVNAGALDSDERRLVEAFARTGSGSLPIDLVETAAPLLLASALATRRGDAYRRAIGRLAAASRRRLQERPPPGARWTKPAGGCGAYAFRGPDDDSAGIQCGLGSVPFLSARFLDFHTAGH